MLILSKGTKMKPGDYDPSMGEQHPSNDLTLWEYHLTCRIHVVKSSGQQGLQGGQTEFEAVCLIPEHSDETANFFAAWLPDTAYDNKGNVQGHEVGFVLKDPPYGYMRGRVQKRSELCDRPHIFVMSVGVEEDILALYKRSKTESRINVKALPANLEHLLDGMKDTSKSHEIINPGVKG